MRNERERLIEDLLAEKADELPPILSQGPDCPAVTDLMDVTLGQAGPEVTARVKQHSETCPACRGRLALYSRSADEEEPEEEVVAGSLLDRVARRVAGKPPATSPHGTPSSGDTAQGENTSLTLTAL